MCVPFPFPRTFFIFSYCIGLKKNKSPFLIVAKRTNHFDEMYAILYEKNSNNWFGLYGRMGGHHARELG